MSELNTNENKNTANDFDEAVEKNNTPEFFKDDLKKEDQKTVNKDKSAFFASTDNDDIASEEKRSNHFKTIVDYIEIYVIAVGFVILLFSFFCRLCTVSGPSMNDTLINGEKVIISDIFYTPKRGDIVVFHDTNTLNEPVVKRVIATAGETVEISYNVRSMTVKITDTNGNVSVLEENYIKYNGSASYLPGVYVVPEGTIFVMGDNRSHSMDSRHPDISFVDERSILGKVLFRITPVSKFGTVK